MRTASRETNKSETPKGRPVIRRRKVKEIRQEDLILEDLVVIADSRRGRTQNGETVLSVNPKLKRITLYKTTKNLMAEKSGRQEFDHVLLLKSPKSNDSFWIRPCGPKDNGARKLNSNGVTKTISCSMLLHEVNWEPKKTTSLTVDWDNNYNALKVEVPKVKE